MKKLILLLFFVCVFSAVIYPAQARLICPVVARSGETVDVTKPTLSTFEIGADGDTWTFTYSEVVTADDDGDMCDGYTITMSSAGALTFTYASGTRGSDSVFTCTGSATVDSGETISTGLDYTQGTIKDTSTNAMDALDDKTTGFTNSSEQGGAGADITYIAGNVDDDNSVVLADVAAGDLLVCIFSWQDADGTPTITESGGSGTDDSWTYIRDREVDAGVDINISIAYITAATRTGNVTYTWTSTSTSEMSAIMQVRATGGTFAVDDVSGNSAFDVSASSSTSTSGGSTSAETLLAVFGPSMCGYFSDPTYSSATINAGAVDQVQQTPDVDNWGTLALTYKKLTEAPSENYTSVVNYSAAGYWICDLLAFKVTPE